MSKETFYFSHDYNTRNDPKIKKLIARHKWAGYGLFWAIIEDLYNNSNSMPTDYETIAYSFRVKKEIVQSVIEDFELFILENNFFGSLSVQKRFDERNSKRLKASKSASYRWEKNANANQSQSDSNAIKESKGKEKKVKESKGNILLGKESKFDFRKNLIKYGFLDNLVDDWIKVRKTKKSTNTETAFKGFIEEIQKKECDLNLILTEIVKNNWAGFKWKWLENSENNNGQGKQTNYNSTKADVSELVAKTRAMLGEH